MSLTRSDQDKMRAAVQRGATLLDEKYPAWFKKIDLDNLNLGECEDCICGQLAYAHHIGHLAANPFHAFMRKLVSRLSFSRRIELADRYDSATHLGFDVPDVNDTHEGYRFLDRQWTKQIKRRLKAAS